jgi:hypothetical protein
MVDGLTVRGEIEVASSNHKDAKWRAFSAAATVAGLTDTAC